MGQAASQILANGKYWLFDTWYFTSDVFISKLHSISHAYDQQTYRDQNSVVALKQQAIKVTFHMKTW